MMLVNVTKRTKVVEILKMDKIIMEHGSGGRATGELIREIFENK